jgi:hypothetical protein
MTMDHIAVVKGKRGKGPRTKRQVAARRGVQPQARKRRPRTRSGDMKRESALNPLDWSA